MFYNLYINNSSCASQNQMPVCLFLFFCRHCCPQSDAMGRARCEYDGNRITKQFFYGELKTRKRPQPKKRFEDRPKKNLNALHLNVKHCAEVVLKRREGRHFIRRECNTFEDECLRHALINGDFRRDTHSDLPNNMQSWNGGVCTCARCFSGQIM